MHRSPRTRPPWSAGGRPWIIGMDRIFRSALPCSVMLVSLVACTSSATDKESEPLSGTSRRASGRDAGLSCDARLERLLPRLHSEPGRSRRHGLLHACGARPSGATRLLGVHPGPTARPPAKQRLRRAAGLSRAWRLPTPDRPRSRLVYGLMPTRGLAAAHRSDP